MTADWGLQNHEAKILLLSSCLLPQTFHYSNKKLNRSHAGIYFSHKAFAANFSVFCPWHDVLLQQKFPGALPLCSHPAWIWIAIDRLYNLSAPGSRLYEGVPPNAYPTESRDRLKRTFHGPCHRLDAKEAAAPAPSLSHNGVTDTKSL